MKKIMVLLIAIIGLIFVQACVEPAPKIIVQGVTDTEIIVGNTAAVSGNLAFVGLPFNAGIEAYFKLINDGGGIAGRTLTFVSYDDEFDQAKGIAYTKRLVEEDEVFALVGHFGTPTVGGTIDYIQEIGVPMVYAATGINALYFQESPGNPVMAVQPIFKTDGRVMAARALNEALYGPENDQKLSLTAKIGVLHTSSDDGISIKEGIELEAQLSGRSGDFIYKTFSTEDVASLTTAVLELKDAGVEAVIIASNQPPFKVAAGVLELQGLHVPVFTSYVNADLTSVDAGTDYTYDMYANAWIDIVDPAGLFGFAQSYWDFVAIMTAAGYDGNTDDKPNYTGNAFAIAGYIAANIFIEGLERVGEEELTWASYIAAMESAPIAVPMGGFVDFGSGKRWGIASMALLKLNPVMTDLFENPEDEDEVTGQERTGWSWVKVRDIEGIEDIQGK